MTIQWGSYDYNGTSNAMRVGIEVSVSSVNTNSTSVTFTYKVYTQNLYSYNDPQTLNFGGSYSGSSSYSFTNNSGNSSSGPDDPILRVTKTYTYNYSASSYGSSPGTRSFSATISGAYNGVTPSKTVTTSIPARPYAAPNAPTNVAVDRNANDIGHDVSWTRNPTSQKPYDNLRIQRREYQGSTWGAYSTVSAPGGSTSSVTLSGGSSNRIYSYQVRAENDAGSSAWVETNNIYNTPAAPSAFNATVNYGTNEVDLDWVDEAYTSIYNRFEIQRSAAGGAWTTVESALLQSGGVAYTDTSPPPGSVQYRIRTYTVAATGTRYSSYIESNTVVTIVDPATPTSVQPAQGSTVTKPNPQLSATLSAISSGQNQKAEWQLASDSGFTTDVSLITEADSDLNASGVHTESPPFVDLLLTNGTWYVRARAVDSYGNLSAWSSGNSFTVNTPVLPTPTTVTPTGSVATMTPNLGATVVADGAGRTQRLEWQVASDNIFDTNVRTVTEPEANYRTSGAVSTQLPTALKITSDLATTWYVRARTLGNDGSSSAWSAAQSFTLAMAAPPTPTLDLPLSGATVTTSEPTLGATLSAATESRRSVAEFQLATDAGFTQNVKTFKESASDLRISGYTTEAVTQANRLFQATWWVRVRAVDEYGQAGSYSSSVSFVVAHKPTASPTSPSNNGTLQWNSGAKNFSFSAADPYPNDALTAYQIIVERNDTGAVLLDTGKVLSSSPVASIATTAPLLQDVQMRWKVRVWDQDDVVGVYSSYALFYLSALPVVTITSPTAAQVIDTGSPTISWTLDGQTTQYARRIVITGSGVNYDTGTVVTTSQTWTAPQAILSNNMSYSVTVYVTDTQGLVGSSTHNFTTSYSAPDEVVYIVSDATYENGGYISIDWSTQEPDGFFVEWHLYRRVLGTSEWETLATYTDQQTNTYRDWLVSNGLVYEYAVTQLAGRSGEILESPVQSPAQQANADGSHYWLINPFDDSDNVKITGVKADSYNDEYEEAEFTVIGRGRKKNQGTRIGYAGELVAQLRNDGNQTAREKRQALQAIKDAQVVTYLRTPFGDVFQIGVGSLSFSRVAGTGTNEFVDVTIPYAEVF